MKITKSDLNETNELAEILTKIDRMDPQYLVLGLFRNQLAVLE